MPKEQLAHSNRSKWARKEFVCYDGEGCDIDGRHQYVYLAAFDGNSFSEVRDEWGLSSLQCFQFLCKVASEHPNGINVIYGGSYDANMMLRDLDPHSLRYLHEHGSVRWDRYFIRFVPRKYFTVHDRVTKATCHLWDVIGFFQAPFLTAIEKWLHEQSATIAHGKKGRSSFTVEQLDQFIIAYCKTELQFFYRMMHELWECLNAVGVKLNRWDGAGAIASVLLEAHKMFPHKGEDEAQQIDYYVARCAYAGGRFELFRPGDYEQPIYCYDINSAYPFAISKLPPFIGLDHCDEEECSIGPYDLVKVHYEADASVHPFFHRLKDAQVIFPARHIGWHWAPEYLAARRQHRTSEHLTVLDHYHWTDLGARPFRWVEAMYDERAKLKAKGDASEKVLKLGLNSLYGKLAQQRGWKPGDNIPRWHQLYWAGWVTSHTRAMLYTAMMQNPGAVIACETDSIFSTEPLDLPLGDGMGQWSLKRYDWLTYVQSGLYFAGTGDDTVTKYRGLDKGQLSRAKILKAWQRFTTGGPATVKAITTRFRTLGTSLVGDSRMAEWRQWVQEKKEVALLPTGKRLHAPFCRTKWGPGNAHLTLPIQPKDIESVPHVVPWADATAKLEWWQQEDEEWEGIIIDS